MTLHEKLLEIAKRLGDNGQADDSATVYSAAFQLAPGPTPRIESFSQPIPGFYHHFRLY